MLFCFAWLPGGCSSRKHTLHHGFGMKCFFKPVAFYDCVRLSSLLDYSLHISVLDKPDPPARVPAASDIRRSSLTLSWYGPTYDGGSIVKSYNLEIWNSLDNTWSDLTSCNSTSYHVQQLLPDRQYKFRVRAVNMYGISEPSAESEPVTVGEPEVPGEMERPLMSLPLSV